MKTYTTLDAIGDMFVIYGIVIVVSMLVALVIRGIVIVLSRQAEKDAAKAPAKACAGRAATDSDRHPAGASGGNHRCGGRHAGRAPRCPHRNAGSRLRLDLRSPHDSSHFACAPRIALIFSP